MRESAERRSTWFIALAAALAGCPAPPRAAPGGPAPEPSATVEVGRDAAVHAADGFSEVYLTVMPDDLALVRELRRADLPEGVCALNYADVVDSIVPESTRVRFAPDGGDRRDVEFLEQRYRYDLLQPSRLLELSLGADVHVHWTVPATGAGKTIDGTLESTDGGLFLRTPDGAYALAAPGDAGAVDFRTALDALPGALFSRPQLDWLVDVRDGGRGTLETSYLAHGFSWQADYVVTADEDFAHADLLGWVTLRNRTGARFDDAHLGVVAGRIHLAPQDAGRAGDVFLAIDGELKAGEGTDVGYVQEGLFEYHLYRLPRPTTLPAYSWKQISFLEHEALPITTKYRAEVTLPDTSYGTPTTSDDFTPAPVRRRLTIENQQDVDGLGVPLPAGAARLYAHSGDDLFFIAATAVQDTPREEPLELDAGGAPFLVVRSRLTDAQTLGAGAFGTFSVTRQEVTMVNRGTREVTLVLRLSLPGALNPGYGAASWDARLERVDGDGPAITEVSTGVWEIERTLAPDVETSEELVLRVRRPH